MKTSFWDHSGKPSVFIVKENGKEIYRGGFEEGYKLINMSIEQDITRLTREWYALMGEDHHKDRDCHWYIETKWSYGQVPTYCVIHHGYVYDRIEENWSSYEGALNRLREILIDAIKEINEFRDNDQNWR
jgi:hypothetical protein